MHRHLTQAELYVVLEGTGRIRIGDELHTLEPLSSALVEPDVVRQVFNDTDADALWLVVGAPQEAANTLEMTPEQLAGAVSRRAEGAAARTARERAVLLRRTPTDEHERRRQWLAFQQDGQLARRRDRQATLDLRAGAPVDAIGVLPEVDVRNGQQRVVDDDREVLVGGGRVRSGQSGHGAPAIGDLARHPLPDLPAGLGEIERHDGLARPARALGEALCRVDEVRPAQGDVVAQHEPLAGLVDEPAGCVDVRTMTVSGLTS